MECEHEYSWNDYCGCYVCSKCGMHAHKVKGSYMELEQCFCGWSRSGRKPEFDDVEDW